MADLNPYQNPYPNPNQNQNPYPNPNQNPYPNPYSKPSQNQNGNQYPQNGGSQPGKGAAIASMVLGIVGMFIAGIILGIIGLAMASKAKNEGYTGGMRTAGFVLSLLSLVLGAINLVVCTPILNAFS